MAAHWDGNGWRAYELTESWPEGAGDFGSFAAHSPNHVWASGGIRGGEAIAEWDGQDWSLRGPVYVHDVLISSSDIAVRGTEVWAIRDNVVSRWNGSKWVALEKRHPNITLQGLAVDKRGNVWAAGYNSSQRRSMVYRYQCAK